MRIYLKSALIFTTILTAGCQALSTPRSDLRTPPQTGTPLAEILKRSNAPADAVEPEQETAAVADPATQALAEPATDQVQLSIGLEPAPKSEVEVSERLTTEAPAVPLSSNAGPTSEAAELQTVAETAATESGESVAAPIGEPVASEPERSVVVQAPATNYPPTVSQQLNWLPSLDDTLSMMDSRVAGSTALDEKIDALMSLAYVIDAKLYISFRELLDRLDSTEAELLMAEQQEWLDQRKDNLTRAYLEFKADKAGRYNAAQAFLRNSHTRMREIDARLTQLN